MFAPAPRTRNTGERPAGCSCLLPQAGHSHVLLGMNRAEQQPSPPWADQQAELPTGNFLPDIQEPTRIFRWRTRALCLPSRNTFICRCGDRPRYCIWEAGGLLPPQNCWEDVCLAQLSVTWPTANAGWPSGGLVRERDQTGYLAGSENVSV